MNKPETGKQVLELHTKYIINGEKPEDVAAVEDTIEEQKVGGEGYVLLKSGEIVAVEVPEITEVTEEKEKGFDKFCSWLNKIFGGKE